MSSVCPRADSVHLFPGLHIHSSMAESTSEGGQEVEGPGGALGARRLLQGRALSGRRSASGERAAGWPGAATPVVSGKAGGQLDSAERGVHAGQCSPPQATLVTSLLFSCPLYLLQNGSAAPDLLSDRLPRHRVREPGEEHAANGKPGAVCLTGIGGTPPGTELSCSRPPPRLGCSPSESKPLTSWNQILPSKGQTLPQGS